MDNKFDTTKLMEEIKNYSCSEFLKIQEEKFNNLPKIDIDNIPIYGETVAERILSLYHAKIGNAEASPVFEHGVSYFDSQAVDNRHAAFAVSAFINTLTIEEISSLIPKTALESFSYVRSPFVMDGRFDKIITSLTGNLNLNKEFVIKLVETLKELSKKDVPTVEIVGIDNGLLAYELEQTGVEVVESDADFMIVFNCDFLNKTYTIKSVDISDVDIYHAPYPGEDSVFCVYKI